MTPAELGGGVLASVSRSFYLSIRILPAPLREPIGLAYLLARASDTIADSATSSAPVRLQHLAAFQRMVETLEPLGLSELQREIVPPEAGEQALIAGLGEALAWLATLDAAARAEIQRVLGLIIRGQTLDLQRFPGDGSLSALQTPEELEEYAYLVAGCVGEFWTRLCWLRLGARYSAVSPEHLEELGRDFGKGLQLVNILRDLPADLHSGRCYLPAPELEAAGSSPGRLLAAPESARAVFEHWRQRALALLEGGRGYIKAIRPARVRAACYLPWRLGVTTLELLEASPPLETAHRVKVSRAQVYRELLWALVAGVSDAPLKTSVDC